MFMGKKAELFFSFFHQAVSLEPEWVESSGTGFVQSQALFGKGG